MTDDLFCAYVKSETATSTAGDALGVALRGAYAASGITSAAALRAAMTKDRASIIAKLAAGLSDADRKLWRCNAALVAPAEEPRRKQLVWAMNARFRRLRDRYVAPGLAAVDGGMWRVGVDGATTERNGVPDDKDGASDADVAGAGALAPTQALEAGAGALGASGGAAFAGAGSSAAHGAGAAKPFAARGSSGGTNCSNSGCSTAQARLFRTRVCRRTARAGRAAQPAAVASGRWSCSSAAPPRS